MERPDLTQLFKYRNFDAYSIEALVEEKIWVSDIKSFNDPFEGQFIVEPNLTPDLRNKLLPNYSEEQCHQLAIYLANGLDKKFPYGVYCLCESNRSGLMWSHYSDGHRGFCIGYERSDSNSLGPLKMCAPVTYGNKPTLTQSSLLNPQLGEETDEKKIRAWVLTKDKNWEYEKEWRVFFEEKNCLVAFKVPIRSITFGTRMSDARRKAIRRILADKNIEYYEAKLSMSSYEIELARLD